MWKVVNIECIVSTVVFKLLLQPATDSNVPTALTGVNILHETSDTNVMVLHILNRPGGPLTSFDPIFGRSQTDKLTATY